MGNHQTGTLRSTLDRTRLFVIPELGAACVGAARAMFGRVRELSEPDPLPSLTRHQHVYCHRVLGQWFDGIRF